jgi:hypothetical protein
MVAHSSRIALAILASGLVSSMTDWLFMGDWLYKRFDRHPEIWRHQGGREENQAILWSSLLPFLTCGVFVLACAWLHLNSYRGTFTLALAMWFIGPLPLIVANCLWLKLAPAIATSWALGWLVKLAIAALAVTLILN